LLHLLERGQRELDDEQRLVAPEALGRGLRTEQRENQPPPPTGRSP
jgi:hypothetical protein